MIPSSLDRAFDDPRLSDFKVRVLGLLHRYLAYHEFRELKLHQLTLRLGMNPERGAKGTISRVLRDLVRFGYLARGPVGGSRGREVGTFMLLMVAPQPRGRLDEWPEHYRHHFEGCSTATLPAA